MWREAGIECELLVIWVWSGEGGGGGTNLPPLLMIISVWISLKAIQRWESITLTRTPSNSQYSPSLTGTSRSTLLVLSSEMSLGLCLCREGTASFSSSSSSPESRLGGRHTREVSFPKLKSRIGCGLMSLYRALWSSPQSGDKRAPVISIPTGSAASPTAVCSVWHSGVV